MGTTYSSNSETNPQRVQFPVQNGCGPGGRVCGPHSALLAASRHSSSHTLWGCCCCFSSRRHSWRHTTPDLSAVTLPDAPPPPPPCLPQQLSPLRAASLSPPSPPSLGWLWRYPGFLGWRQPSLLQFALWLWSSHSGACGLLAHLPGVTSGLFFPQP